MHTLARSRTAVAPLLLLSLLAACGDRTEPVPLPHLQQKATSTVFTDCGASMRLITWEEDDELNPKYGWAPQTDTVDVCETWTGSDYRFAIQTVGTSENFGGAYSLARDASYEYGYTTVTEQGSPRQTFQDEATLFESVGAEPYQVQASYDDPYYAIRSAGGYVGDGGGDPGGDPGDGDLCPPDCGDPDEMSIVGGTNQGAVQEKADGKFKRHGLQRKGIRAFVEEFDEVARTKEGRRRFEKKDKHGKHAIEIEPNTQLIVGEELDAKDVKISARHSWRRRNGAWIREETSTDSWNANGKYVGRSRVQYTNVRINTP